MKAIDRAKNHFSNRRVKVISVPEWTDKQGDPLLIYVNPMTVLDRQELISLEKRYGQGLILLVHVLIEYALNDQGRPHFTLEDKHSLLHEIDPDILTRIADQMFDNADPEAIKKK